MNTKNFLKFLLEDMSYAEAQKFFGIKGNASLDDISKIYRKLSMKYHPDRRGGSNEMMSKLNQARDILRKNKGFDYTFTSSGESDFSYKKDANWEERRKEYEREERQREAQFEAIRAYVKSLLDRLNPDVYCKYIEEFFGRKITVTGKQQYGRLGVAVELSDAERDIVFTLIISSEDSEWRLRDKIFRADTPVLTLKGQIIDFRFESFVLIDGKKQVLQKGYSIKSNNPKFFTDPTIFLPEARMKKLASGTVRKGTVARRDFNAVFRKQFGAKCRLYRGDHCYDFPLFSNEKGRVTILRTKFINFYYYVMVHDYKTRQTYNAFFPETEESLKVLINAFKQLKQDGSFVNFGNSIKRHGTDKI